jgi:hypothetical protein
MAPRHNEYCGRGVANGQKISPLQWAAFELFSLGGIFNKHVDATSARQHFLYRPVNRIIAADIELDEFDTLPFFRACVRDVRNRYYNGVTGDW